MHRISSYEDSCEQMEQEIGNRRHEEEALASDSTGDDWEVILSEESEGEKERWAELERRTAEENERRLNTRRWRPKSPRFDRSQPVMMTPYEGRVEPECWTVRDTSEEEGQNLEEEEELEGEGSGKREFEPDSLEGGCVKMRRL